MKLFSRYTFAVMTLFLCHPHLNALEAKPVGGAHTRTSGYGTIIALTASALTGLALIVSGGVVIGVIREATCDKDGSLACCNTAHTPASDCSIGSASCGNQELQRCVVYGQEATNPINTQAKRWALGYGITAIIVGAMTEATILAIVAKMNGRC